MKKVRVQLYTGHVCESDCIGQLHYEEMDEETAKKFFKEWDKIIVWMVTGKKPPQTN